MCEVGREANGERLATCVTLWCPRSVWVRWGGRRTPSCCRSSPSRCRGSARRSAYSRTPSTSGSSPCTPPPPPPPGPTRPYSPSTPASSPYSVRTPCHMCDTRSDTVGHAQTWGQLHQIYYYYYITISITITSAGIYYYYYYYYYYLPSVTITITFNGVSDYLFTNKICVKCNPVIDCNTIKVNFK